MQKKAVSLFLAFLLLFSATACQNNTAKTPETSAPPKAEVPPVAEEPTTEEPSFPERIVLLDGEDFFVEISQFKKTQHREYTLLFHLENRTDNACTLTLGYSAFNDVLVAGSAHIEADGGATTEKTVTFVGGAEDIPVENITKIEFSLNIYDNATMETLRNDQVVSYPFGEENHTPYQRQTQPTDQVLLEKDGFEVVLTEIQSTEDAGLTLQLYVVNATQQHLTLALDKAKINNKTSNIMGIYDMPAQKHQFASITWTEEDLRGQTIADITSILLEFYVSDANDWLADPLIEKTVEIIP